MTVQSDLIESNIDIQWVGHRKDGSSRGSIFGWFIRRGDFNTPSNDFVYDWTLGKNVPVEPRVAYVIRGRIGKTLHIEEHPLTFEFLKAMEAKEKNFKRVCHVTMLTRWGVVFNEEMNMFITMMKLRK